MELFLLYIATIGIVWVSFQALQAGSAQAFQFAYQWNRHHQRTMAHRQGVLEQVQSLAQTRFAHHPVRFEWQTLVVADIVQESDDCKSFVLIDPSGELLPGFLAGQHLLVERPAGKYPALRRCYSLSNGPHQGFYRMTIKAVEHGTIANSLSQWMHSCVSVGDTLRVKGPQGHFFLDSSDRSPVVLLSAGVGITPSISILEDLIQHQPHRESWLFYQVRDHLHEPFAKRLNSIAHGNKRFHLHVFHSRPVATSNRSPNITTGKFTSSDILRCSISLDAHFYLCGPEAWMDDLVQSLEKAGYQKDRIHWESFGGASPAGTSTEKKKSDNPDSPPSLIHLAKTGKQIEFGSARSLSQAIEAAGVMLDLGCRKGSCGSCVAKLLRGKVIYDRTPECHLEGDQVALCTAQPVGDVEIDL